ncbi:hypothetical protein DFJ66_7795 [Saccharothrix variisporea]|uniref:Uncharacterized protein n=1 Tax=Saccharothrix variisporea TaxID=543527 RepID=A0A495XRY7_9PSEU|nr:hypothetical protein DFJ66_7795 [Saccharothrix variisporea]
MRGCARAPRGPAAYAGALRRTAERHVRRWWPQRRRGEVSVITVVRCLAGRSRARWCTVSGRHPRLPRVLVFASHSQPVRSRSGRSSRAAGGRRVRNQHPGRVHHLDGRQRRVVAIVLVEATWRAVATMSWRPKTRSDLRRRSALRPIRGCGVHAGPSCRRRTCRRRAGVRSGRSGIRSAARSVADELGEPSVHHAEQPRRGGHVFHGFAGRERCRGSAAQSARWPTASPLRSSARTAAALSHAVAALRADLSVVERPGAFHDCPRTGRAPTVGSSGSGTGSRRGRDAGPGAVGDPPR